MQLFKYTFKIFLVSILLCISSYSQSEIHKPQQFLDQVAGKSDEGLQIVHHYCSNCHGKEPLIPLDAPTIHDKDAWKLRLQQDFDKIFEHTDNGLRAMPARGGCFECSDEQLLLAILALIPKNEHKAFIKKLKVSKKYNELKKNSIKH